MIGSICSEGTNSTTSTSRLRSSGSDLRSSSVSTTVVWPSAYALSMCSYSTTLPQTSHRRWYRIRPPSASCTWCSSTSWSSVALYSFTGTFTRPKVIAPFQIALMSYTYTAAVGARTHPTTRATRAGWPPTARRHTDVMAPKGGDQTATVDGRTIKLTNLDKVLYPETGTTKADVIAYYAGVGPTMLPHLYERPATRKRWPDGVAADSGKRTVFFNKDLA